MDKEIKKQVIAGLIVAGIAGAAFYYMSKGKSNPSIQVSVS